ncbi:MAG: PilN domain-containing protein [Deltaproteobacteria bacterium]|nr:PilN domain-containing protein [Deltaproteobacteria bacterium]
MIRINLLPVRAAKKKETVRFQLTVAGLITFMVVMVSFGVYLMFRSEAGVLARQIETDKKELDDLAKKIGKLSKIEEEKAVVQEKLDTIKKLEEGKAGPVNLFKVVSRSMPDKAWLSNIRDDGAGVTLKGYAADERVVAELQRRLQEHVKDFGAPDLVVAQRVTEKETGVEVVNFEIRVTRPAAQVQVKDKKAKKKDAAPAAKPAAK